jgi:hypothetical protein
MRLRGNPCGVGDEFEGPQPGCVVVDNGHNHELVGSCLRNERVHTGTDRVWRADYRTREHAHRLGFLGRRPITFDVIDRRLAEAARAAEYVSEGHLTLFLWNGRRPVAETERGKSGTTLAGVG